MALHTILGASGTIAKELIPVLVKNKESIRLVSRNPQKLEGADSIAANLLNEQEVVKAVQGSSIVYLLVGIEYDATQWQKQWPVIMANAIKACKQFNAKLIFFDNVYMYGKVNGRMTETSAFDPCSKKGALRAKIASQLLDEMNEGNITALIARSADFYGPIDSKNCMINMLVFENLKKKKPAQWLLDADLPHSFTYVPDAAKALYVLASSPGSFGQTWHLPTATNPLTGREFIEKAAIEMGTSNKIKLLPKWMIKLAGIFIKPIRESYEMLYQIEAPYIFDSSKFNQTFDFEPMSYEEGIKSTARMYKTK